MKTRHDRTHRRTQGNEENRKKRSSFYEAEGGFVTTRFLLFRWFTTYGAEATVPECQSNVPSETEPQLWVNDKRGWVWPGLRESVAIFCFKRDKRHVKHEKTQHTWLKERWDIRHIHIAFWELPFGAQWTEGCTIRTHFQWEWMKVRKGNQETKRLQALLTPRYHLAAMDSET